MKKLNGSQFGEGIGQTVQLTDDPNNPLFDPATHTTETDKKIRHLLSDTVIIRLNDWERNFVMNVYGCCPLTRKQHIQVSKMYRKYNTESK